MYPSQPLPEHAYDTSWCRERAAMQDAYAQASDDEGNRVSDTADILADLLDQNRIAEVHMDLKDLRAYRQLVASAYEDFEESLDQMEAALLRLKARFG